MKIVIERIENAVVKGENAGYQNFLPFSHNIFKRFLWQGCSGKTCKSLPENF